MIVKNLAQLAFFSVRFESAFMRRMARIATSSAPAAAMGSVAHTMAVKLKCYLDVTVAQQTLYCFRIGLDADEERCKTVTQIMGDEPPTDKLSSASSAFESEDGAFADQERDTAQNAEAAVDETPR